MTRPLSIACSAAADSLALAAEPPTVRPRNQLPGMVSSGEEGKMNFDPATCIHCDQIGESVAAVVALWVLWLTPAGFLIVRRLLREETRLRSFCRDLATAGSLT